MRKQFQRREYDDCYYIREEKDQDKDDVCKKKSMNEITLPTM